MILQTQLSQQQEERRREGLRTLVRIIARHYVDFADQYAFSEAPEAAVAAPRVRSVETRTLDLTDREEVR